MSFVIIGSVFPQPEFPYNVLPIPFVGYMVVGAIWFAILKIGRPQRWSRSSTTSKARCVALTPPMPHRRANHRERGEAS